MSLDANGSLRDGGFNTFLPFLASWWAHTVAHSFPKVEYMYFHDTGKYTTTLYTVIDSVICGESTFYPRGDSWQTYMPRGVNPGRGWVSYLPVYSSRGYTHSVTRAIEVSHAARPKQAEFLMKMLLFSASRLSHWMNEAGWSALFFCLYRVANIVIVVPVPCTETKPSYTLLGKSLLRIPIVSRMHYQTTQGAEKRPAYFA